MPRSTHLGLPGPWTRQAVFIVSPAWDQLDNSTRGWIRLPLSARDEKSCGLRVPRSSRPPACPGRRTDPGQAIFYFMDQRSKPANPVGQPAFFLRRRDGVTCSNNAHDWGRVLGNASRWPRLPHRIKMVSGSASLADTRSVRARAGTAPQINEENWMAAVTNPCNVVTIGMYRYVCAATSKADAVKSPSHCASPFRQYECEAAR